MADVQRKGPAISRLDESSITRIATIGARPLVINGIGALIALGLFVIVFKGIWNVQIPQHGVNRLGILLGALGLIAVHEGIHGAAALMYVPPAKISFKTGWLVVMCKVNALMTRDQFVIYSLAPAIVLGLAGIALYYAFGSIEEKFLSALLFLGGVSSGGGDFWFAFQLLKFDREVFVTDRGIEVEVFSSIAPSRVA